MWIHSALEMNISSTLCERCVGLQQSVWCVLISIICVTKCFLNLLVYFTWKYHSQITFTIKYHKEVVHVSGLCKILTGHYVTFIKSMYLMTCISGHKCFVRQAWKMPEFHGKVMWLKNKTKQDVLCENRVYYCIEKDCLLGKFKPKVLGKLHRKKAI